MISSLYTDKARLIAWVYTGLILLLVALPLNGEGQFLGKLNHNYVLKIRLDYLSHAFLFVPWVLIGAYGYKLIYKSSLWIGLSYLLALTFAGFCEYLQLMLPYRTFNINDLMANELGVTIGYLFVGIWVRAFKK